MECSFPFENKKFNVQRFAWSNDNKRMLLFDKNEVIYADIVTEWFASHMYIIGFGLMMSIWGEMAND